MAFLWYGQICVPVAVAILEDCYMAIANMQVHTLLTIKFEPVHLITSWLNGSGWIGNTEDPDQTAPLEAVWSGVCSVCTDMPVWIFTQTLLK